MRKIISRLVLFAGTLWVLGIMAFSGIVMLLWNHILTPSLHIGAVTFWQATGILLLVRILFGGRGSYFHRHNRIHAWDNKPGSYRVYKCHVC